jgi:hypothetical protein
MSETQNTEVTEAPAPVETAEEKLPGYVPRTALSEQVNPLKEQIDAQAAELAKYKQAEEERKQAALKEANDFEALEATYKEQIANLEAARKADVVERNKISIESKLIAAGLNPEDPRDKLTMSGILAGYDGESEPAGWFETFKTENGAIFEATPRTRTVSATGSPATANVTTDIDKLAAAYKRGDGKAIDETANMVKDGRITQEVFQAKFTR